MGIRIVVSSGMSSELAPLLPILTVTASSSDPAFTVGAVSVVTPVFESV